MTRDDAERWLSEPVERRFGRAPFGVRAAGFAALALVCALQFWKNERYLQNEGLGDDGFFYGTWIRLWRWDVPSMGLHSYSAQRVVGVGAVRVVMQVLHIPYDAAHVVSTFVAVNYACVLGCVLAWNRVARLLGLTRAGWLVGASALFLNWNTLKWLPFDPVLTDAQGCLCGALAILLWLERRPLLLAALSVLGAFVWPSFGYVGCVLLAVPRPPKTHAVAPPGPFPLAMSAAVGAVWIYFARKLEDYVPPFSVTTASHSVFLLSLAVAALALTLGLRHVLRLDVVWAELRFPASLLGPALAASVLYAVRHGIHWIAQAPSWYIPQPPDVSTKIFVENTAFLSVQRPAIFVVAHAVYFGPWVILALVRWSATCAAAARLGAGLLGAIGLLVMMGMNSESRRLLPMVALAVPPLVLALGETRWRLERLAQLGLFTLAASKVWYRIIQQPTVDKDTMFSSLGPWMPQEHYYLALGCAALVVVWGRRALREEGGVALVAGPGET